MAIYLHGANLEKEKLNLVDAFLTSMGYERAKIHLPARHNTGPRTIPDHLPDYFHNQRMSYPVVTIANARVMIDDAGPSFNTQTILGFMIRQLEPTHWNTDLEVVASNPQNPKCPELHYRQKFSFDLPYVPQNIGALENAVQE